jgi:hypothetical protein
MFLQSQTEWVYRQTTVMMTFYVILGALASLYYHKRRARSIVLASGNLQYATSNFQPQCASPIS